MKQVIYYPALSVGVPAGILTANTEMAPGLGSRFYNKDYPDHLRHPYFLLTAGHLLNDPNARETFGIEPEATVMGDSGGYQIFTGFLKWEDNLREKILTWLENNSNIALNLDIPMVGTTNTSKKTSFTGYTFNQILDVSYDNFKYFDMHRQGKTDLLNVLHGLNEKRIREWYNRVKIFDFDGWALGGPRTPDSFMLKLAILLESGELDKLNNKYLHILGCSKISDFFILAIIQNTLNEKYGDRIQVSVDSSSPGMSAAMGNYMVTYSFKDLSFQSISLSKYDPDLINSEAPLPCLCDICKHLKVKDIARFKTPDYGKMILHNLFVMKDAVTVINNTMLGTDGIIESAVPKAFYRLLMAIKGIVKSNNPVAEYYKHSNLFRAVQPKLETSVAARGLGKFA